jgi:hypothetical protein
VTYLDFGRWTPNISSVASPPPSRKVSSSRRNPSAAASTAMVSTCSFPCSPTLTPVQEKGNRDARSRRCLKRLTSRK